MKPQVYHVDAFTSQPFRGNSAGVVFPADNLSEAQMQLIARELGHSETAFLLHSDDSDVRIRYFTPTVEVPICGHATVAAHYVRAKVLGLGNCTIWQTSLAGKHRVTIEKHNDDYRISLEQGTPGFELPLEGEVRAAIINALHLTEDDILPGLPIQVATTGHSKVMIPLKPEVDIDALSPAIGIVEDPVTGNANGPMGAWLVHHNVLPHDGKVLRVKGNQGRALGRDGVIEVTVTIRDNQPEKVTISGAAVILFHAEWAIKL
ncbi:PhzF family phenazine biosynthesis isomerase [Escherichia coli]|nr:PhzF family phenazine biosynthesis isomerase [Escherichia coli]